MAGFCDVEQRLCLGLALWNGRDPILKERMFGLTGAQGNHGEDVKEYWWYLDAVPSHAWNRWRYHYPQAAFPYDDLIAENGRRGKLDPEYELLDTGVFDDDRYWIVEVDYAKADPTDLLMTVRVDQRRARRRPRCTCCRPCGSATPGRGRSTPPSPSCAAAPTAPIAIDHPFLGDLELLRRRRARRHRADARCSARTRPTSGRLFGADADHAVPQGRHQRPRRRAAPPRSTPTGDGTKAALLVPARRWRRARTVELRLRLRPAGAAAGGAGRARRPTFDAGASPSGAPRPTSSTPS